MKDRNMKKVKRQNAGFGKSVPPQWQYIKIYFVQKGLTEQVAKDFFQEKESKKWQTENGKPVLNWKAVANEWIWNYTQGKQEKDQITKFSGREFRR